MNILILLGERIKLLKWEEELLIYINSNYDSKVSIVYSDIDERHSSKKSFFKNSIYYMWKLIDLIFTKIFYGNNSLNFFKESLNIHDSSFELIKIKLKKTKFRDELILGENFDFKKYDIVLRLGYRILTGSILNKFNSGIISLHHGNMKKFRGGPAGFWEFISKSERWEISLQKINENLDSGKILLDGSVFINSFSYHESKFRAYSKGIDLIIEYIDQYKQNFFFSNNHVNELFSSPIQKLPKNKEIFSKVLSYYINQVLLLLNKIIYKDHWTSWYVENKYFKNEILNSRFKMIPNIKGSYIADPFPFNHNNTNYIFFEQYINRKKIGVISVYDIENKILHQDILNVNFHLSFPSLFKVKDDIYLLFEAQESNKIIIAKSIKFPVEWELTDLIDSISIVDPRIMKVEDGWIILCSKRNYKFGFADDNLICLHSSHLLSGQWNRKEIKHDLKPYERRLASASPNSNTLYFQSNKNFYGQNITRANYTWNGVKFEIKKISEEKIYNKGEKIRFHTLNDGKYITTIDKFKKIAKW